MNAADKRRVFSELARTIPGVFTAADLLDDLAVGNHVCWLPDGDRGTITGRTEESVSILWHQGGFLEIYWLGSGAMENIQPIATPALLGPHHD